MELKFNFTLNPCLSSWFRFVYYFLIFEIKVLNQNKFHLLIKEVGGYDLRYKFNYQKENNLPFNRENVLLFNSFRNLFDINFYGTLDDLFFILSLKYVSEKCKTVL